MIPWWVALLALIIGVLASGLLSAVWLGLELFKKVWLRLW